MQMLYKLCRYFNFWFWLFQQTLEAKQEAREKRLAEVAAVAAEKKVKEEKDHDMDEEKAAKNGGHEDNEDYDDDLPLEDEDNEGGLMEDGISDLVKDTTAESFLNETSADSSFVYLSGDMVQEQQERALLADSSGECAYLSCVFSHL